jgi:hypothetical protein
MAHFAEIDENNIVKRVLVLNNEVLLDENNQEQESLGIALLHNTFGGEWVQTSYNGNFRGYYAAPGMLWDSTNFTSPVGDTDGS